MNGYLHRGDGVPAPPVRRHAIAPAVTDWSVLADTFVRAVEVDALTRYAESMHLTVAVLRELRTGWDGEAWTTPMRNGKLRIIGIQRRFPDGTKRCVLGSKPGLFVPDSLNGENPIYVAEGASDTAALAGIGLPVLGLFNAGGNAEQVIQLLDGRGAILVADNDEPAPLDRVGGAERTAAFVGRLRNQGINLQVVYPVGGKDARAAMANGWRPGQTTKDGPSRAGHAIGMGDVQLPF